MASTLWPERQAVFLVWQFRLNIGKLSTNFTDMIRRRNLRTRSIKLFVLDEADEMLNKGFKEQIYDIYRYLPPNAQVCLLYRLIKLKR